MLEVRAPRTLSRKIREVVDGLEVNGWEVEYRDARLARPLLFAIALGVTDDTGRVAFLGMDHGARFAIAEDGTPRYWYSRTVKDWKVAVADPIGWCGLEGEVRDA